MDRDILIIDTPPGTSDEHITVMENLRNVLPKVDGAILVTTPQVIICHIYSNQSYSDYFTRAQQLINHCLN